MRHRLLTTAFAVALAPGLRGPCMTVARCDEAAPQPTSQAPAAVALPTPPAVPPEWLTLVAGGSEAQREAAYKLVTTNYPTFAADLWDVATQACPDLATTIWPRVTALITTKYPAVSEMAAGLMRTSPELQDSVAKLIATKYPSLMAEIRELPEQPDQVAAAGGLIRTRHPELLADVLVLLKTQYPAVLSEAQHQLFVKYPGLVLDVLSQLAASYPQLPDKIRAMLAAKYPRLVPEALQAITQPLPQTPAQPPLTGPVAP